MAHGLLIALLVMSARHPAAHTSAAFSTDTQHIAMIIGMPLRVPGTDGDAARRSPEEMEKLVAVGLDVDIATAGINNEINELTEEQARLQSRSDSKIKKLTFATILFGAAALVGELIEFDADKERLGAVIETAAAAAGVALGVAALHETDHGKTERNLHFNMLAQVLDRPALPTSTYPAVVWSYLTSELPGSGGSPRELLLQHWSQGKLLGKKGRDEATIDSMTSSHNGAPTPVTLTLDDIQARIAMLTDVSVRIAMMKKGLRELTAGN
jgi:hypothetical protein